MSIPNRDIDKLKFLPSESIKLGALNAIYEKLIENDNSLIPTIADLPGIWECRWWNDNDTRRYYKKGEAVWINTEVPDDFVKMYEDTIYEYCMGNPLVASVADNYRNGGEPTAWTNFCKNIVAGTYDYSIPPLYYLGELTDPVQLRISTIDGNNTIPSKENVQNGYWRDFFIEMTDDDVKGLILSAYAAEVDAQLATHLNTCHLSGVFTYDDDGELPFLQEDFSNVIYGQHFENHSWHNSESNGFACVKYFKLDHPVASDTRICHWFRIWSNGLLEHGGIVKPSDAEKGKPYTIELNWKYDDGPTPSAPSYDYPSSALNKFYLRDSKYAVNQTTESVDITQSTLAPETRYLVLLTPIITTSATKPYDSRNSQLNYYEHVDTLGYTNTSFQIIPTTSIDYYSYYVRGYSAAYRRF